MITITVLGDASTHYQPLTSFEVDTVTDAEDRAQVLRADGFDVRLTLA
jgi:hypothetical protein